jgi:hypothetical protein
VCMGAHVQLLQKVLLWATLAYEHITRQALARMRGSCHTVMARVSGTIVHTIQ